MKKIFAIIMSVLMIACFMPTMAFAAENAETTAVKAGSAAANTVTLPEGVNEASFSQDGTEKPVYYNNTYYTSINDAIAVAKTDHASDAVVAEIYCKPNADVQIKGTGTGDSVADHIGLTTSITIYGNGATLNAGWEPNIGAVNKDGVVVTIKNLGKAGIWGETGNGKSITVILEDCQDVHEVLIPYNCMKGGATTTIKNCTFKGSEAGGVCGVVGVSQECGGTLLVEDCTFEKTVCGVNCKNDAGELAVTIKNCSFKDCATSEAVKKYALDNSGQYAESKDREICGYAAPIRRGAKTGASGSVTISGCTFNYTGENKPVLDADIIIGENRTANNGGGTVTANISDTAGRVKIFATHASNVESVDSKEMTLTVNDILDIGNADVEKIKSVALKDGDKTVRNYYVTQGKEINLPTPTLSGHTFNGWYNEETEVANPYTVTGDVTLTASWSRIRSGGSSSSSTATTTTDNVTNKTEDKGADTSTSTGTTTVATTTATVKTETKTATDGTKTTTATVDTTTASKIVEKAVENKSEEVVVDTATAATVTETAAGTKTEVALPEQTVKAIAKETEAAVTIKSDAAEVKLDTEAVKAVADQAGDLGTVSLVVETVAQSESKVEVDLKLVTSQGNVTDFKGGSVSVTVKLNTTLAAKPVACVYIDDFGTYHKVKGVKNADGTYTFETGHFSTYAVMAEEEADEVIAEQTKNVEEKVGDLKLKARSAKTEKGNIKVTLTADEDEIKAIEDLGYTVKYKFYRSTKKAASYKAKLEVTNRTYTNTTGKKDTKYYYKARVMVYDAQGALVTKSELKQCKYACRIK